MNYDTVEQLRHISVEDLAVLGLRQVAYVRPIMMDGQRVFSVHAANGQQVAVLPTQEAAWVALKQNDLDLAAVN